MQRMLLFCFALLTLTASASAQATRYEVGQRLKLFEQTLDKYPAKEARKRAMEPLVKTTPTFFSGRLAEVANLLDQARRQLVSDKAPSENAIWAESLFVRPNARLVSTSVVELSLGVQELYKSKAMPPAKAKLGFTLASADGKVLKTQTVDVSDLPIRAKLPVGDLPEGDYVLTSVVQVGEMSFGKWQQTISLVRDLTSRLKALTEAKEALADKPASLEKASLSMLLGIVSDLAGEKRPETDYPASRLLREAEELAKILQTGKSYYGPDKPGQFWMTIPSSGATQAVRLQVPVGLRKEKPVPIVVALHGAGGSENMFFDGYGAGLVAKLAKERGWLVVATRSPLFAFSGGPDVLGVIDTLAKVYPVDTKKVFLVGHSMGAAQAVALAGRRPERLAGVAALGGGGGFQPAEGLKQVPFFVGVGDRDFALSPAKRLAESLSKAGVKKVTLKVYEDVEHLSVVQLALHDVFAFFDKEATDR